MSFLVLRAEVEELLDGVGERVAVVALERHHRRVEELGDDRVAELPDRLLRAVGARAERGQRLLHLGLRDVLEALAQALDRRHRALALVPREELPRLGLDDELGALRLALAALPV